MTDKQESQKMLASNLFDEPDDELEEFEESAQTDMTPDADALQWEEGWDVTGWDDEDVDRDFIEKLKEELEKYKKSTEQVWNASVPSL